MILSLRILKENRVMWNSPLEVFEFKADHPFVFQIVDKQTSTIILCGTVRNPTAK